MPYNLSCKRGENVGDIRKDKHTEQREKCASQGGLQVGSYLPLLADKPNIPQVTNTGQVCV